MKSRIIALVLSVAASTLSLGAIAQPAPQNPEQAQAAAQQQKVKAPSKHHNKVTKKKKKTQQSRHHGKQTIHPKQ